MDNYKKSSKHKETRWDRIRKKHINTISTECVKKFFGMDFISKQQLKAMNVDSSTQLYLDPSLVMAIRHKSIKISSKRNTLDHIDPHKSIQIEKTKRHNNLIEERYLDYKINKFRQEFNKTKESNNLALMSCCNQSMLATLEEKNDTIYDIYRTCLDETLEQDEIIDNGSIDKQIETEVVDVQRYVRFANFVEIIDNSKEESIRSMNSSLSNVESVTDSNIDDVSSSDIVHIDVLPKENDDQLKSLQLIGKPLQSNSHDNRLKIEKVPKKEQENQLLPTSEIPLIIEKINFTIENSNSLRVQDCIISDIFSKNMPSNNLQKIMLQTYFLKWVHFATIQNISRNHCGINNSRIQKMEIFLNNIRLDKKKSFVQNNISIDDVKKNNPDIENPILLARKYHNKMKIQQDIIELQKIKLERQERMITELKLSKFSDCAKESKSSIKEELKNLIKNGCTKSKVKAKCLQMIGNLKDADDDKAIKLNARAVPKFLTEMQARALERNNKHREARERREKLEREKEEMRIAADEAKRALDEDAKRRRIEELREKRHQEKLQKIQKENDRIKYIENIKRADIFYRHTLLTKLGMERLKILIKIKKRNQKKAMCFQKRSLIKRVFKHWSLYLHTVWNERKKAADACYNKYLKRLAVAGWKNYHLIQNSKMLVAIDWSDMKLSAYILQIWIGVAKKQKLTEKLKMRQAEAHHNWQLKWRVIDHWQRLQAILKIEKETEERRERWRMKIWELLPDYTPQLDKIM